MERGSGDSSFIFHESFKNFRTRRAEQEAYRKALDEQIMQRKMLQEEERQREQDEARKELLKQHCHYCQYRNEKVQSSQQVQPPVRGNDGFPSTPTSFRRQQQQPSHSHHNGIENPDLQASSPKLPSSLHVSIKGQDGHLRPPLFPKFQGGEGRMFHNLHQVENFNEPHPAALARTTEECYNDSTAVNTNVAFPPSSTFYSPRPNLPTSDICQQQYMPLQYIQQPIPGFYLPAMMSPTHQKQNYPQSSQHPPVQCHPSQPIIPMVSSSAKSSSSPSPAQNYDNNPMPTHAFSSGFTSESPRYEVVSAKPTKAPKVHVSQTYDTYEQLQSLRVEVSRSQYRAELQLQIDERRKREAEQRKKEQEAEERIQEKIRIEQEMMQKEYEEELRQQQEKELEAEALGKQSKILKAEKKMKAMGKKVSMQPPSQRKVWHVNLKRNAYDNVGENELCANPSESKESIDSICDFFEATMTSPRSNRQERILNPDDCIVPAVANRLKKSFRKKSLENIEDTACHGEASYGPRKGHSSSSLEYTEEIPLNMPLDICDREIAIRSAPAKTLIVVDPTEEQDFLSSLKNYLEDEKTKLMERIETRSSRSNEGF